MENVGVMASVDEFANSSPALQAWMRRLGRESTKRGYAYHFYHYFTNQVLPRKQFSSPDDMVRHAEACSSKDLYQHLDMLEDYVKFSKSTEGRTVSHRSNIVKAVRSFYLENRVPLPKYVIRYGEDVPRGRGQEALSLNEVEMVISRANDRDKAIFLAMLQGGIGPAELVEQFNYSGYQQVVKQVGELESWQPSGLEAVRVDLVRKKTQYEFYTFISTDAIAAIKQWLRVRRTTYGMPYRKGEPLFVTNRHEPVTEYHLQKQMRINRAPWQPQEDAGSTMSKYHPHELRDTFESTCAVAGIDRSVREFFLGHNIDRLGYDKSPRLYPEHFKLQYLKASKMLNIISKPPEMDKKQMFLDLIRSTAPGFGIDPMRVRVERQRELGREPSAEEEIQAIQVEMKKLRSRDGQVKERGDPQAIVKEEELDSYLRDGWQFVSVLPSQRILVRK